MTDHDTSIVDVKSATGWSLGWAARCATIQRDVSGLIMASERSMQYQFACRFVYDEDGCWDWVGPMRGPYGRFYHRELGKYVAAHRAALMLIGVDVPAHMDVDHLCRNKVCVNPCHLEVVTHWENTRRGNSPHAQRARQTHCKRGHAFDAENTLTGEGTRRCRICRNAYARERAAARRYDEARERPGLALIDVEKHTRKTEE